MSNAYSQFVRREQKRRGWSNVQLADAAGVSKQVVGDVLNDTRTLLRQRPEPETVRGLAKAFGVPEVALWQEVVKAMGIPLAVEATLMVELEKATNADLLSELAKRLEEGGAGDVANAAQKSNEVEGRVVDVDFGQMPEVPSEEDAAAHDPGVPSQGDLVRDAQDQGYDIDQDRGKD